MADEFLSSGNEYQTDTLEYSKASEFFKSEGYEEIPAPEITPLYDEFEQGPACSKTKDKENKYSKLKKMIYLVAACGSAAGIGYASYASYTTANVGTELTEIVSEVEEESEEATMYNTFIQYQK